MQFAYDEARKTVQQNDPDRYFSTLFAPEESRKYLFALYAFNIEISRIRDLISQPLPGEVRLQWWRDVIETNEAQSAHPVAAALLDTVRQNGLPVQALINMLDARIFDLYDDIMPDWHSVDAYCGETSSAIFRLATLILSKGEENNTADICGHAGIAYTFCNFLRNLPRHSKRGQVYFPQEALKDHNLKREDILTSKITPDINALLSQTRSKIWDHLAQTHAFARSLDRSFKPVFLPLATIKPYLKQMTKRTYEPFETHIDLANWQRIWAMIRFGL